jgi:hypothetical protein
MPRKREHDGNPPVRVPAAVKPFVQKLTKLYYLGLHQAALDEIYRAKTFEEAIEPLEKVS